MVQASISRSSRQLGMMKAWRTSGLWLCWRVSACWCSSFILTAFLSVCLNLQQFIMEMVRIIIDLVVRQSRSMMHTFWQVICMRKGPMNMAIQLMMQTMGMMILYLQLYLKSQRSILLKSINYIATTRYVTFHLNYVPITPINNIGTYPWKDNPYFPPWQYNYYFMKAQSYAPFGSLISKRNKKKKSLLEDPGPGAYDISLPIIMPIVQTIRKKNNNVIVKLGHIGTASFQNDQDRFKARTLPNIGPGQYSPQKSEQYKQKGTSKHRSVAGEWVRELIKNPTSRSPTISQIKELEIGQYVQMPDMISKRNIKASPSNLKGSIWSKMTEERDIKVRSVSNLGPGEYDYKQRVSEVVCPSAAFRSESVRSYFDQIYYDTNQEGLAKEREQRKYKGSRVGPGKYNLDEVRREFHKYQFFGSTEQRKLG